MEEIEYLVIEFSDKGVASYDVIPSNWYNVDPEIIFNHCKWPAHLESTQRIKAAAKRGDVPADRWETFRVAKIFFKTTNWKKAHLKAHRCVFASGETSDDGQPEGTSQKRLRGSPNQCSDHVEEGPFEFLPLEVQVAAPACAKITGDASLVHSPPSLCHTDQPDGVGDRKHHSSTPFVPRTYSPSHVQSLLNNDQADEKGVFLVLEKILYNQSVQTELLQKILEKLSGQPQENNTENSSIEDVLPLLPCRNLDELRALDTILMNSDAAFKELMGIFSLLGGSTLRVTIGKMLKYLLDSELAKILNLTGAKGKIAFLQFQYVKQIITRSIRCYPEYKDVRDDEIAKGISLWFTDSRDRGMNSRKKEGLRMNFDNGPSSVTALGGAHVLSHEIFPQSKCGEETKPFP